MESKNLLTLAITLTVGIILAGSLLMPVISDATTTERTFANTGYYYMETVDSDGMTYTFNAGDWELDGEALTIPTTEIDAADLTVIATDKFVIRANGAIRGSDGTNTLSINLNTATISIDDDSVSIVGTYGTSSTIENDIEYSSFYGLSDDKAPYLMSKPDKMYLNGDSNILGAGATSGSFGVAFFYIIGSITDGVTVDYAQTLTTHAITEVKNITINATEVNGYEDLYQLQSITFDIVAEDVADTSATYNRIIIPSEVTSELSQHLAPGEIAILNALPILIIVALVVMAAGALYLKRDD